VSVFISITRATKMDAHTAFKPTGRTLKVGDWWELNEEGHKTVLYKIIYILLGEGRIEEYKGKEVLVSENPSLLVLNLNSGRQEWWDAKEFMRSRVQRKGK
jgi:hypothetical protein